MTRPDIAIIGGGIIGIATALEIQNQRPDLSISVFEKENELAQHQTGRNSGVIHAGVYYPPNSLKARFCREGSKATKEFCDAHDIHYKTTGKLIVATQDSELNHMAEIGNRARQSGIEIEDIDESTARKMEPNIQAIGALLSPSTGIVDFAEMTSKMADLFLQRGGRLFINQHIQGVERHKDSTTLQMQNNEVTSGYVISCAGLYSDRIIRMFGLNPHYRIIPFRGEYFRIRNQPDDLISHLIYPVPDPKRPFLGVHMTRKINGNLTVGPNAVLAAKREGYKFNDLDKRDLKESLGYLGFWRMLAKNLSPAVKELYGSFSKNSYLQRVQRYCPQIELDDLEPYRAGVRAQAVSSSGKIIDDFLFVRGENSFHVGNAPSPASTAAFPIAKHIVREIGL